MQNKIVRYDIIVIIPEKIDECLYDPLKYKVIFGDKKSIFFIYIFYNLFLFFKKIF